MLTPLKGFLNISINKAGIQKSVEAARVCFFWGGIIKEIFNQEAAEKSKAIRFKNGILTVAVLSSTLAQEFNFKEREIKEKINEKLGGEKVRKIRFEV